MVGYILNLSPKKKRETDFNFRFQFDENVINRGKCYDPRKRSLLEEHKASGNAMKLKNLSIYEVEPNSGLCEITINNQSRVEVPSVAEIFSPK